MKIRIDANEIWTPDEAAARLAALEPFGIELAEQPVAGLDAMAELRGSASRSHWSPTSRSPRPKRQPRRRGSAACDAVTVKLSKTGSLDASLGGHLPTYLSSALDGPVGIAAAAHVAQTLPARTLRSGLAHGLATERLFFVATVADREALLEGPLLPAARRPRARMSSIDEGALNRHRL